ncbi:hypothetical protein [Mesorhizobium sp.]|uniref:hypothetical protein n=1 Tax=Mesorhizobium sp. TaxID=1871066 RepID=UPI0025D2036A|nr:hypothetical protein [Mesorhizobium sp.]
MMLVINAPSARTTGVGFWAAGGSAGVGVAVCANAPVAINVASAVVAKRVRIMMGLSSCLISVHAAPIAALAFAQVSPRHSFDRFTTS